jgi:histone H3/H4
LPRARLQPGAAGPRDVLVVVSKLKLYIRATADMHTSDDVVEVLSDRLRDLCDAAVEQARAAGRKTVMARDFRGT